MTGSRQPSGPPAAPAASLSWEVLAAIDVASVPVCVSLCVPATATGSPCPLPCPTRLRPCRRDGSPLAGAALRAAVSGRGAGHPAGWMLRPGWLCRAGVPVSPLQTLCTQGLEEVAAVHPRLACTPREQGRGPRVASRGPAYFPVLSPSPLLAVTPSPDLSPSPGAGGEEAAGRTLPGLAAARQGVVAGATGGPLPTRSWGVCGGHTFPPGFGHPAERGAHPAAAAGRLWGHPKAGAPCCGSGFPPMGWVPWGRPGAPIPHKGL